MRFEAPSRAVAVRCASVRPGFLAPRGARTGTDGRGRSGHADRPARLLASGLAFQDVGLLSPSPSPPGSCSVSGGAEGVGDALVGGLSLPVDAVRVDLQQDGDAVPGAAGDLGRGHPRVQQQRHRSVAQVRAGCGWRGSRGRHGASARVPAGRFHDRSRPYPRGRRRQPDRSGPIPWRASADRSRGA
jgi:hypothetical protein